MNAEILKQIITKKIEILKFLEDENLIEKDKFNNSDYLKELLKNGNFPLDCINLKISRGNHYIEMGAPSEEDLIIYNVETKFSFVCKGNIDRIKHFIATFSKYERENNFPSVFKNCDVIAYDLWEKSKIKISEVESHAWAHHYLENSEDYYISEAPDSYWNKKPLFYIELPVIYKINSFKIIK